MRRSVMLGVLLCSTALAADGPALGERFVGPYDVSFKPFVGGKSFAAAAPGEITRVAKEDKNWLLTFSRFELPDDIPLRDTKGTDGKATAGYQTLALSKLRSADPDADVLRNEVLDLGDLRLGVLTVATQERKKPSLTQQVLIEVTPRLYYSLVMTSPLDGPEPAKSPAGRDAATAFKAITDSIERVDLSEMKREQDERLFRARGLFAQWSRRTLLGTLVPQQYLRIKRDGKDVGYVYVVEQAADNLPKAGQPPAPLPDVGLATGLRIGRKTHLLTEDGKVVDTESWAFVTFDRAHEVWSVVTVHKDPSGKTPPEQLGWSTELGASDRQRERVFDRDVNHDTFKEFDQRNGKNESATPFREVDRYKLSVTTQDVKTVSPPLERELPPFYLPQALGLLLPRLVPLNNATGYLFAVYQSDQKQVMLRYVDVSPEADVTIDGKRTRAVAVSERIGYAGVVTTHYLTPKGQFLGTRPADSRLELLPSDKATLQGLWKDIDLTEPGGTK